MKTNSKIAFAAGIFLASFLVASAENYTLTIKPGFNFIVNQLDNGLGNTVAQILPSTFGEGNDNSIISMYDVATQQWLNTAAWWDGFDLVWYNPNVSLSVGRGFFFNYNDGGAGNLNLTFTGTRVSSPVLLTPTSGTYQFVGNQLPEAGTWDNIFAVAPGAGTIVYRYNNSGSPTSVNTFDGSTWSLGAPTANIGEAWNVYYVAPVPEPAVSALLGLGVLFGFRRFAQKRRS
jgi:hypothetical protein